MLIALQKIVARQRSAKVLQPQVARSLCNNCACIPSRFAIVLGLNEQCRGIECRDIPNQGMGYCKVVDQQGPGQPIETGL